MKDMNMIRIENLKTLASAYKSQKTLADAIDCTPGYVNQLLLGTRSIGEKTARKIEVQLHKPTGWLDVDRDIVESANTPDIANYCEVKFLDDYNDSLVFKAEFLAKNGYKQHKLIAAHVKDGSMESRLCKGDAVLINTDDSEIKEGRVFAINYEGNVLIKRFFRDAGAWWLSSDNSDKSLYPNKIYSDKYCTIIGLIVHRQSSQI